MVKSNRWASSHPHTYSGWCKSRNVLLLAKAELEVVQGKRRFGTGLPGAGCFDAYSDVLRLSDAEFRGIPRSPKQVAFTCGTTPDPDCWKTDMNA